MDAAATEVPQLQSVHYRGWQALRLERGPLALVLVPQVGGRIMAITWKGRELSFVNPEYAGRVIDVASIPDLHEAKRTFGFVLWGGDKTWLAPQDRWTDGDPFLDLDSGAYAPAIDRAAGSVTMTSPVCRETGVRIERTVTIGQLPGTWSVASRLINASERPLSWAPWDVDMMLRPATVFLPTSRTSAYPQGVKTFAAEGDAVSARDTVVSFVDDVAVVSCDGDIKFKYGVDADSGHILAVLDGGEHGLLGYRKTVPTYHPQPYGHGCVLEIFNASAFPYIEMEVHGPVVSLRPGESFTLTVSSALFALDAMPTTPAAIRNGLGLA